MLRIGIAGVGGLGQMHLRNLLGMQDVQIGALACRSGKPRNIETNLGQTHPQFDYRQVPMHTDFRPLCERTDLDVVVVALPTDLHADAAVVALETGKHVFSEKPMAISPEQGRRMLDAARQSRKLLMIGHCLRFFPEYLAADELLRSGELGQPLVATMARCGGQPAWGSQNWFNEPKRSGGAALDLHIHDADIAVWWWGRPATIETTGRLTGNDAPNLLQSRWRYANGLQVQFESCWDPCPSSPFYFNFKVVCERGTLLYDTRSGKGLQVARPTGLTDNQAPAGDGYKAELRYFLDCVGQGLPVTRCDPNQSLVSLECAAESGRQLLAGA